MKTTDLTRGDVVRIAAEQSAIDSSCAAGDFFREEHVVVLSRRHDSARKYLSLPFALDLVSYGRNVVASARKDLMPAAEDYLRGRRTEACFETPALHELDGMLAPYGLRTCHQAEYFLPDPEKRNFFPVRMFSGSWKSRIFPRSICRSGAMPCARPDGKTMFCASAHMTAER